MVPVEVGHDDQIVPVNNVLLDVLRHHLIHERIRVGEEEQGILPILRLQDVVVEAGGIHHVFYIVMSKRL